MLAAAIVDHLEGERSERRAVGASSGVNSSWPMSTTAITWFSATGTPASVSVPVAGSVVMMRLSKLCAGSSFGSVKPKSAGENV